MVALSTTKAEFIAAIEAMKEEIWLQGLLRVLSFDQKSIIIYCDIQSVIHLIRNLVFHVRSKHIDVRMHFIRNVIEECVIGMEKIATTINPVDPLTKPLNVLKSKFLFNSIGCVSSFSNFKHFEI